MVSGVYRRLMMGNHYQGENVSQIDLNGQTLSSHQWEQGQEIRRHMGRFGELTFRHQFDERGRLHQQTLQLHQTLSKPIERRYDYNVVREKLLDIKMYKGKQLMTLTYYLKQKLENMSNKAAQQAESYFKQNPNNRQYSVKVDGYWFQVTRDAKTGKINNAFLTMPPRGTK